MNLGTRRIRSAGRSSGSIEMTLPKQLFPLKDVECRLVVRDGSRPEIVLQPDLGDAQDLFGELWRLLRLGLGEIGDTGDFALGSFAVALFPPRHWQSHPPLAYVDALAILQGRARAGVQCGDGQGLGRLLAFLGVAAVHRLGLTDTLALGFGDAVAYLMTGVTIGLGTDFERGTAHRIFWGRGPALSYGSALEEQSWQRARPDLRRLFEQFHAWQEDPHSYATAREKWYRALAVEVGLRASSVCELTEPDPSAKPLDARLGTYL